MRILFLLVLPLMACGVKVVDYTNGRANFRNYSTYTLLSFKGETIDGLNPTDFTIDIEENIQREMLRRNYQENDLNPDLLLRYELIASTKIENRSTTNSMYGYQNYAPPRSYTEAVLLIELVDSSTRKLVWQASADLKDHQKKSG